MNIRVYPSITLKYRTLWWMYAGTFTWETRHEVSQYKFSRAHLLTYDTKNQSKENQQQKKVVQQK